VSRNAFQEIPAFFSSSFVREVTNEVAMDDDSCVSGLVSMNYTADVRLDTGVCVMRTIFPEAFSVLILMRLLSLSHNCQVLEDDSTSCE